MAACPPSEQLRGFASGILSDDVAAAIESHVTTCHDCKSSIALFAKGSGGGSAEPSPDALARIGRRLGRYRVDKVLGMGGMGIVYAAWDPQLDRPVAIKVVHRAAADAAGRARLVREAQSLARLSHPNVCHVYDVGTEPAPDNPEGDVWVAMELIDGTTLRDWAQQRGAEGRNNAQHEVLPVLLAAGDGIAAAHAAGMIHRDIKPENVLVTKDGRAVVTDFGLARLDLPVDPSAQTAALDPLRTATNAIVGTPAYLAPEQLTGGTLDARVDQFAWAVMAWELLAGVRPFPAIPIVRLDAIIAGPKPHPSLSKPLAAALARAMAAAPRDRFGSLRELLDAVKPAAAVKPANNARTIALVAGAVVVAVAATIAVWKLVGDKPAEQVAVAPPAESVVKQPEVKQPEVKQPEVKQPDPPTPAVEPKAAVAAPAPTKSPPVTAPTKPPPVTAPKQQPLEVGPATKPAPAPKVAPPPDAGDGQAPVANPGELEAYLARHPYDKSRAVAVLDAFCRIPIDPSKPDPKLGRPIADWGRVTRRELGVLKLGNRSHKAPLYEVKGYRGTYRFTADHWSNTVGVMDQKVGGWVVLCVDQMSDLYELPANWKGPQAVLTAMVPVSREPRVAEIAKYNPLHTYDLAFKRDGGYGKTSLDTSRRFLVRAKIEGHDGGHRYDMSQWWIDVPPGTPGASMVGVGKRLWFVVENLQFEDQADGSKARLVVKAVHVIDELFP